MKRAFLLLLFVPFLFSCSSSEDDRLIREKLSSLTSESEWFWIKLNSRDDNECVLKWFQDGHVYVERCVRLSSNPQCFQDWSEAMPLDEISILNETPENIVFSYRNEIHEVILSNNGNTVQLKYNSNPNYDEFIVDKISDSKLTEWKAWDDEIGSCN